MQEGLLRGLVRAPWWRPGSLLSKVEVRGKEGEGKSSNSEWHVEPASATTLAPAKPKPREGVGSGGLSSLALGPRRNLVPETLTYFTFYSTLWGWGSFQNIKIYLGSFLSVFPLPYRGMTLSLLIPALQTGQICLFGRVSSHWNDDLVTHHLINWWSDLM